MNPKEELIQAIERSPDDLVCALLQLLKVLQQRSPEVVSPVEQKTVLERMGGEPKQMLSVGGLSDRDRRRDLIAMRLQQKYRQDS
ncbi:hypothetical protein [Gloeocapsopsis dulcis]|uniref:Uncharacterized protein n=1 Tax=Gloeocapsopsis dulcis AAB1 = 1H9 TaxID=1433147 RepID=A0A6N8FPE6_9CHRO|nr:hypothetical protein [Gloeocapsopsis dulcis]MUL35143.1 hypothetical protein [Gloeocapsopsis dulcis AAB1 = 1H9]WNN89026.1 hypothetical protein P0S91_22685 [Gloeocapsopsis dulcis]